MKLYELLFLFKKERELSKKQFSDSSVYITIAYNNVINKIKERYDMSDIIKKTHITSLNITEHMKNKLSKLLTKKLTIADQKHLNQSMLLDDLTNIIGIGKVKAQDLINRGLTSISQLKQKKYATQLPESVILLVKYKPTRLIPHGDIKKIESKLTNFKKSPAKLVGGFLRKKPFSKDIDVMLISAQDKTILNDYIAYLKTKFTNAYVYAHGDDKVSLIVQINPKTYYKIDVFRSPVESQHAMLLYATGSKQFNIRMRAQAKRKGYLLNQHGLFKLTNGQPTKRPILVKSEMDFFQILGLRYVSPENR